MQGGLICDRQEPLQKQTGITFVVRQVDLSDLVVTSIRPVDALVVPGQRLKLVDRIENTGVAGSSTLAPFRVAYFLTGGAGADIRLTGARILTELRGGVDVGGARRVTVPVDTPEGAYRVKACADDRHAVAELDEANNCLTSSNTVLVAAAPYVISVHFKEPTRPTEIDPGNRFSENTAIYAVVRYPPSDPREGDVVTDFNGWVTFEEDGTSIYDGIPAGETKLPSEPVRVTAGVSRVFILRSLSDSPDGMSFPQAAIVRASAKGLVADPALNPIAVSQWVDQDDNKVIDWLEDRANAILKCARGLKGQPLAVARAVSSIGQLPIDQSPPRTCGCVPSPVGPLFREECLARTFADRSPILLAPYCNNFESRLNETGKFTFLVLHEARHAWQLRQIARGGSIERFASEPDADKFAGDHDERCDVK